MSIITNPEQATYVDDQLVDEIYDAYEIMWQPDSPVLPTQLHYDQDLSNKYEAEVWLASELHQPIGAYKIRGAYNFVQNLSGAEKERGVVTASAGNHGQGIALSCKEAIINCHVFMPENTPQLKVDKVRALGGESTQITLTGKTFDESQAAAQAYCDQKQATFAPPFDHRKVIAGQGTWGVEIAETLPDLDMVFCPVGGMGLLTGVASALKYHSSQTKIVGVEPEAAASLQLALKHDRPVSLEQIDTYVDGAAVKRVGNVPFILGRYLVDDVATVPNFRVRKAVTRLWEREQPLEVELAGALSVSALGQYKSELVGKTVVCLLSGGNLSRERYENEVKIPLHL